MLTLLPAESLSAHLGASMVYLYIRSENATAFQKYGETNAALLVEQRRDFRRKDVWVGLG